jgi:glycosyltransferase involved in cell wall biosynthesis
MACEGVDVVDCHDKGQEYVIDPLRLLRSRGHDAALLLVGSSTAQSAAEAGNHETLLRRRVAEHGLAGAAKFAGYRSDVARLVQAADVQLVASIAVEGQSRTVPQAFASEVPVVATTAGGLTELVVDGGTGRLVPPRDGDAIADAVAALLRDKEAAASLVAAARRLAVATLSLDAKMADNPGALSPSAPRPQRINRAPVLNAHGGGSIAEVENHFARFRGAGPCGKYGGPRPPGNCMNMDK